MLLIREQMDIPHALWDDDYLVYTNQIVGFAAPRTGFPELHNIANWLFTERKAICAYIALTSSRLFTQKATALKADDVYLIPSPDPHTLDLSVNEQILVDDIVDYQRDLIRLGDKAPAMVESGQASCSAFSNVFTTQINTVYKERPLHALEPQILGGVSMSTICIWRLQNRLERSRGTSGKT